MAPKPCAHCGVAIELPPQHAAYWRCGACRKVNGRPAYARGCRSGVLGCGLCSFYASRLTHAAAVALLVAIIGAGLLWALPLVTRAYSPVARVVAWAPALALSATTIGAFARAARSDPGRVPRRSRAAWADALRTALPPDERAYVDAARLPWSPTRSAPGPRARAGRPAPPAGARSATT